MNLDKAKKRIAKQVKKGDNGYPKITLAYFGPTKEVATQVAVQFVMGEGDSVQEERFSCETEIRDNELIQTTLLKVIERANVNSVIEVEGVRTQRAFPVDPAGGRMLVVQVRGGAEEALTAHLALVCALRQVAMRLARCLTLRSGK